MKYITLKEQLLIEREKNAELMAAQAQDEATIEYLAMMCDIDLEPEEDEEEEEVLQ